MAGEYIRMTGVDDLKRALKDLDRKMRFKVLRNALRAAARVIQTDAKARAPVLRTPTPRRNPGALRRSIVVRASKLARRKGMVGVYVTVSASKARRNLGAYSSLRTKGTIRPNDPFYFRFLEEGWIPRGPGKKLTGGDNAKRAVRRREAHRTVSYPFLGPALQAKSTQAVQAFERSVLPEIAKANKRK